MGKKQKMKKAALAAAAKRAQSAALAEDASKSSPEKCCGDVGRCGSSKAVNDPMPMKHDVRSICSNMQSILNLVKLESPPISDSDSCSSGGADSDDDDGTLLEETGAVGGAVEPKPKLTSEEFGELEVVPKYSRGEKKARRLLMKLDLQPVKNVTRVTMRKSRDVMLFIDRPEVFKCPNTMTLICFGEVRVENTSNTATVQAAERYINDVSTSLDEDDANESGMAANGEGDFYIDELGSTLDDRDIDLVQMQATCTRQAAIKALVKHNSDVVNAIMDLTLGADI